MPIPDGLNAISVSRRQFIVGSASLVGVGLWPGPGSTRAAPYAFKHGAGLGPDEVRPATNPAPIPIGSDLILVDTGSGTTFRPGDDGLLIPADASN